MYADRQSRTKRPARRLRGTVALALLCTTLLPATARPDEAESNFQRVYAPRLLALRSSQQRIDFAAQVLIPDAVAVREDKTLSILLFKRAAELAAENINGAPVAVSAMRTLGDTHLEQKAYADDRILHLLEDAFKAQRNSNRTDAANALYSELMTRARQEAAQGNYESAIACYRKAAGVAPALGPAAQQVVAAESKRLKDRHDLEVNVTHLKNLLAQSSDHPAAARQLVRALLVEMDRPTDAEPYLPLMKDPAMERIGIMAAQNVVTLNESEAGELGRWYAARARESVINRAAIEARARACFTLVLQLHREHDGAWLEAKSALDALPAPPTTQSASGLN